MLPQSVHTQLPRLTWHPPTCCVGHPSEGVHPFPLLVIGAPPITRRSPERSKRTVSRLRISFFFMQLISFRLGWAWLNRAAYRDGVRSQNRTGNQRSSSASRSCLVSREWHTDRRPSPLRTPPLGPPDCRGLTGRMTKHRPHLLTSASPLRWMDAHNA